MYIRLDGSMGLTVTANEPIYCKENLRSKITFVVAKCIGGLKTETASLFLSYVRADGTPDIVLLERSPEEYNLEYWKFLLPITCRMTRYPGTVHMWIQIYDGSAKVPTVAKSSLCSIQVQAAQDIDPYLEDDSLSVLYQFDKKFTESIQEVSDEAAKKADDVELDNETGKLSLTAAGEKIGNGADLNEYFKSKTIVMDSGNAVKEVHNG